jgi:hypothetical protein
LAGLEGQFTELLLIALDELAERHGQALRIDIAHDNAVGDLEEKLGLASGLPLRVGVGHIEAEVDDDFFRGRVNPVGVGINGTELTFIQENLNGLLGLLGLLLIWLLCLLILYFFRHD